MQGDGITCGTAQTLTTFSQAPANLCIFLNNKEPLVTIKPDGSIEYGPNYTPDATAKVMWEAMGFHRALYEAAPEMLESLIANTKNLRALEAAMREKDPAFADIIAVNAAGNDRIIAKATGQQG